MGFGAELRKIVCEHKFKSNLISRGFNSNPNKKNQEMFGWVFGVEPKN